MEEKINIAEILKDKKDGIRLYSPIFGECTFCCVCEYTNEICVKKHNGVKEFFDSKGLYYNTGDVMLFPSKEMRDWEKFCWKRGDVLINSRGLKILFDRWANDNYTSFYAKTINLVEDVFLDTNLHTLASENEAKYFIKCIEEKLGGKLNRETLEVENTQPEFKDGDIVVYGKSVAICRKICKHTLFTYVSIDETYRLLFNDNPNVSPDECRFATEEEKKQLFEALAKEGKVYDSKKKQIVDLKPKWMTLKPFDKVITRVDVNSIWTANIFSHMNSYGEYVAIGCVGGYHYCLPYNDETAHLIGTTDEWKGGKK